MQPVEEELKTLRDGLRDPEIVLKQRNLSFEQVPYVGLNTTEMSDAEIDELCRLDSKSHANSGVIGYQQMLSRAQQAVERAKRAAQSNSDRKRHTIKVQIKLTSEKVDRYTESLRLLLIREWNRQGMALQVKNYYDTCEGSSSYLS
jgi:hypothetical protein